MICKIGVGIRQIWRMSFSHCSRFWLHSENMSTNQNYDMTIAPSDGHNLTNEEKNLIEEHANFRQVNSTPQRIYLNRYTTRFVNKYIRHQREDACSRLIWQQ